MPKFDVILTETLVRTIQETIDADTLEDAEKFVAENYCREICASDSADYSLTVELEDIELAGEI